MEIWTSMLALHCKHSFVSILIHLHFKIQKWHQFTGKIRKDWKWENFRCEFANLGEFHSLISRGKMIWHWQQHQLQRHRMLCAKFLAYAGPSSHSWGTKHGKYAVVPKPLVEEICHCCDHTDCALSYIRMMTVTWFIYTWGPYLGMRWGIPRELHFYCMHSSRSEEWHPAAVLYTWWQIPCCHCYYCTREWNGLSHHETNYSLCTTIRPWAMHSGRDEQL